MNRLRIWSLLAWCGIGLCLGCGSSETTTPADPDRAVAMLRTALDAWKKGDAPESLQSHSPPIYFNEHEWKQGTKLFDYKLEPTTMSGRQVRCVAKVTWQTKAGKKTQDIAYLVETEPHCVIVREDL